MEYSLEECVRLTRSEVGYLHFINPDQITLRLFSWSKQALNQCSAEKTEHYPIKEAGVWADCFRIREPVIHNDYQNLSSKKGYPDGHFPVIRHMSVPVYDGDEIVAIIGVGNKKEAYVDSDIQQLTLFMDNMWRILKQKEIEIKVKESETKYRNAYDRAEFYKDLFAHDISNILQNINISMGIFSMLDEVQKDSEMVEKITNNIKEQVIRGAKLINNIRKLSEIEGYYSELEALDIFQVLQDDINFIKKSTQSISITISVESQFNKCLVLANDLLQDVFENIFFNAVKHNLNEKKIIDVLISIEHVEEQDYIKMQFVDNAMGIPEEMKKRIFKGLMKRNDSVMGMGLGLTLVYKIIQSYHGKIWVENRVQYDYNKGSNFIILIPEGV